MKFSEPPARLNQRADLAKAFEAAQSVGLERQRFAKIGEQLEAALENPPNPPAVGRGVSLVVGLVVMGAGFVFWSQKPTDSPMAPPISEVASEAPTISSSSPKTMQAPAIKKESPTGLRNSGLQKVRREKRPAGRPHISRENRMKDAEFESGTSALTQEGTLPLEVEMMTLARAAYGVGDWERANKILGKLLNTYPETALGAEALRLRALSLSQMGRHSMAELLLQKLLKQNRDASKTSELLFFLGRERVQLGDCTRAVQAFEQALAGGLSPKQDRRAREGMHKCGINPK